MHAIHESFYPGQRRTHSVVPVQIVTVVHCTVAQPKSGEGENKDCGRKRIREGIEEGEGGGRRSEGVEGESEVIIPRSFRF